MSSSHTQSATWSKEQTQLLVEIMVEEVKASNRTTSTFNKVGWKNILVKIRSKTNVNYEMKQLTNKFNKLRQQYASFKRLMETTGFGWNPILKIATAEEESLWEIHIKANPEWAKFRKHGLPDYEDLCKIFGGTYASGEEAITLDTTLGPGVDLSRDNSESIGDYSSDGGNINIISEVDPEVSSPTTHVHRVSGPVPPLERHEKTPNAKRRKRKSIGPDLTHNSSAIQSFTEMCLAKRDKYLKDTGDSSSQNDFSIAKCVGVLVSMNLDIPTYSTAILSAKSDPTFREVLISAPPHMREITLNALIGATNPPQ